MSIIDLSGISKIYKQGENKFKALDNISLKVNEGEMIAVMGPSGSGKSTLLNIIGCMDTASVGEYHLNDIDIGKLDNKKVAKIRNRYVGFIFQYFALMKDYSVLDNVEIPLIFRKMKKKERREICTEFLDKLGIKAHIKKRPPQLSGGEQQRVAIARALVTKCPLIIADEPTGALDQKTGRYIMDILSKINKEGKTIIIATHDANVASYCKRKIVIEDGKIVSDLSA